MKSEDKTTDSIDGNLEELDYYLGRISKYEADLILKKKGTFLIRKTEQATGSKIYTLSVRGEKDLRHFVIHQDPTGLFYFEQHKEASIPDLVQWYISTKTSLSKNIILTNAVKRPKWMLNREMISLRKKVGEETYGEIFIAKLRRGAKEKSSTYMKIDQEKVIVKVMKADECRSDRLLLKEARILRSVQHKFVVKFIGMVVHECPMMLITEYYPKGTLRETLRKEQLSEKEKLKFANDLAEGMAHLAKKRCVHKNISSDTILLSDNNEVKISSFEFSDPVEVVHDDVLYDKMNPKIMSPEILQDRVFCTESDVWAFGVLLWEIFTNGAEPYPGITTIEGMTEELIERKQRLPIPENCNRDVADVILSCWREASWRPKMEKLRLNLREIFTLPSDPTSLIEANKRYPTSPS